MSALPPAIDARLRQLPQGLRDHIERTRQVARDLSRRHQVDAMRVDLGAAGHDLARGMKGDALLEQARRYNLALHGVESRNPILLHGPLAAVWLAREGGVTDEDVLEAIRWHSTGRRGMGPVAKVVFLADKLDPQKVERHPQLERVETLAKDSLDRAILEFLNQSLAYLLRQGRLIHPESVELRNELMASLNERVA